MGRLSMLGVVVVAYCLLLEGMLVAAALFWPEFLENLGAIRSMAANLPILGEEMLDKIDQHGFSAYLLAQHFFKGCNTLGTAAAVLFAAPAIAGEVHRGTLELWLARPFSRRRLLLERWCLGALALVLPVLLTSLTIPWLGERVDEFEPLGPYLACAAYQSLFLLALYALTFLVSCLGSNPHRIAVLVLFLMVAEFALYMVKTVTHVSIFRLCDMTVLLGIFDDGRVAPGFVVALVAIVAACLLGSLAALARRCP